MTDLCQRCADGVGQVLGLDMVKAIADISIVPEGKLCEFYLHKRIYTASLLLDKKAMRRFTDAPLADGSSYYLVIDSQTFGEVMGRLHGNYDGEIR